MKKWLEKYLICPECREEETPLTLVSRDTHGDDVQEGDLTCPSCKKWFQIRKGVAILLPEKTMGVLAESNGYNSQGMLSSYLWSHFSEFFEDPEATDAYRIWSSYFQNTEGAALDIGCSVGRLSFELSKTHSQVIGIDTSLPFIRKAREVMTSKQLKFELIIEGQITEKRSCDLNAEWRLDHVEFVVADALALPFKKDFFSTVTSINLLEKVPNPIGHLKEMNRVLNDTSGTVVFSDPFSWDEKISEPDRWLGGTPDGRYSGRGADVMRRLMSGEDNVFYPGLTVFDQGAVSWKIRKTANLWEHINSQYLVGKRK